MTTTPLSRSDGTLTNFTPLPIPDHIAGASEAEFLAFALEWRKRALDGKETHSDLQLVVGWLAQCLDGWPSDWMLVCDLGCEASSLGLVRALA